MAKITNVTLVDDLDGSKAAETVSFGIDGIAYDIDLSVKNAKALRKALAEFVQAGRSVRVPPRTGALRVSSVRSKPAGPNAAVVRQWAHETGVPVSVRGRVSADVRAQYLAAHGDQ